MINKRLEIIKYMYDKVSECMEFQVVNDTPVIPV